MIDGRIWLINTSVHGTKRNKLPVSAAYCLTVVCANKQKPAAEAVSLTCRKIQTSKVMLKL